MHRKNITKVLTLLSPSILLRALAMDIFIPCLPVVAYYFDVSFGQAQWVLSIYFIGAGVGQLLLGPLSDRFGRRPVILYSIVIFIITSLACAFATSLNMLIFTRLLQGIGASGTTVVIVAIIRDLYEDHITPKVYSHLSAIISLAPLFAPLIGGSLLIWTGAWQSVFYFVIAFGIITLFISHRYITETSPRHTNFAPNALTIEVAAELGAGIHPYKRKANISRYFGHSVKNFKRIITDRNFLSYIFCAIAGLSGLFLFFSSSSVLLIDVLGVSADKYGIYFGCNSLVYMIGNILSPKLQKKYGIDKVITLGFYVILLGAAIMLAIALSLGLSIYGLLLPNCIITFGIGWLYGPCAAGAMHKFKAIAGTASATYGALLYCISSLFVSAVMQLHLHSTVPIAVTMLVFGVLSLLVMRTMPSRT